MKAEDKSSYWTAVILDWERSDLSQPAFCKERDISYAKFCYWRYELKKKKKQQAGHFRPVKVSAPSPITQNPVLSIELASGVALKLEDESQVGLAAKLLKALQ